jgi:hypothetical protein
MARQMMERALYYLADRRVGNLCEFEPHHPENVERVELLRDT